ncbi:hypothetical protein KA082_01595 [Candidatus Woesebacteria bacterium]|nr:hypothetical protein [Candidatus Woesebacteria bacterium]
MVVQVRYHEHMACPTFIFADQLIHYPFTQVGELGIRFGELFTLDVPLPPLFVIPRETLLRILRENQIVIPEGSFGSLSQEYRHQLASKYAAAIRNQAVPAWFASEFLQAYHAHFENSFVQIKPSKTTLPAYVKQYENSMGEANCLESILGLWAETVSQAFETAPLRQESLLAPEALVVQGHQQPITSGSAQSSDTAGRKHLVLVSAIWGAPQQRSLEEHADLYAVDVRTWQVVQRNISKKTQQYFRGADTLSFETVSLQYQEMPALTDQQAQAIATAIFAIKQKHLTQQLITWELTAQGLYITHVRELHSDWQKATHSTKTITKLYISAGNPEKHTTHTDQLVDGVGVLRSEYSYAKFGVHPLAIVNSNQKNVLLHQLVETIRTYQSHFSLQPVLFRSLNCTSSELRDLRQAPIQSPEVNPYLGFRGGLQLLQQPELLSFELSVLEKVLESSRAPLGYLLPFMRTGSELEAVLQKIEKSGILKHNQLEIWLQANTPENLLNIRSFPVHKLRGISVNIRSIHGLLVGADPDTAEIYEHYTLETTGLFKLLEEFSKSIAELQEFREFMAPLKLNMHIEYFSHELVALAIKLGYHGIVVKPAVAQVAHASILDVESKRFAYLK